MKNLITYRTKATHRQRMRSPCTNIGFLDGHAASEPTDWMKHAFHGGTSAETQREKGVIFDLFAH